MVGRKEECAKERGRGKVKVEGGQVGGRVEKEKKDKNDGKIRRGEKKMEKRNKGGR